MHCSSHGFFVPLTNSQILGNLYSLISESSTGSFVEVSLVLVLTPVNFTEKVSFYFIRHTQLQLFYALVMDNINLSSASY